MRIAYLIHHVSSRAAGVMEVVRAHARELSARGHTVAVFGYDDAKDPTGRASIAGATVHSAETWLSLAQGYSPRLERAVHQFAPDVLHTHGIWTGLSLTSLRAQALTRAPLVISPHGMLDPWAIRHKSWKKRVMSLLLERRHLQRARLLHALSAAEAADLSALGLSARVTVLPNGVGEKPTVSPASSPPWRPSSRPRVLLFLGRIHEKKGVFELVDAFERLAPELPAWRLVIAGFGEDEDEERLRQRLATATVTEFVGRQGPEARHVCYEHASAFVLPSHSEGLPMTVLEAWSHARPALISPACHLEIGLSVGAALPITPDARGLTAGLRALGPLGDDELAERGQAALQLVRREFSWTRIGAELESEYQRLLA